MIRTSAATRATLGRLAMVSLLALAPAQAFSASWMRFIAIGDMPYAEDEEQAFNGPIRQAIQQMNPSFVLHYGDIKSGKSDCSDALLTKRRAEIEQLHPGRVFYTPGDNEWTDCDRAALAHPESELDRLSRIRELFYSKPMQLPADWAYARQPLYPENARWIRDGVMFVTVHLVGTDNGRKEILKDDTEWALAQVHARDQANRVWLDQAFEAARTSRARAMVVATQADVTLQGGEMPCSAVNRTQCDAFARFRDQLRRLANNFHESDAPAKPVLLVHGDTRPYCWDKRFGGAIAPNLWRLNAWGDFQTPADATEIIVQPADISQPFIARTLTGKKTPEARCE